MNLVYYSVWAEKWFGTKLLYPFKLSLSLKYPHTFTVKNPFRSALRAAAHFSVRIKGRKRNHERSAQILLALLNKYSHARIRRPQTVNPRICSALQRVVRLDLPSTCLLLVSSPYFSLLFPRCRMSCGFNLSGVCLQGTL